MYKVIKAFTDIQDDRYPYNVGDTFPHVGMEVSPERIEELATDKNRRKTPLIEFVGDTVKEPLKVEGEVSIEDAKPETIKPEEEFINPPVEPTEPVETDDKPKKRGRKKNAD